MSRVATAEAVVSFLNSLNLSQNFTAEKRLYGRQKIKDVTDLTVLVTPQGGTAESASRDTALDTFEVVVIVGKDINPVTEAGINDMIALMEEMYDALLKVKMSGDRFVSVEFDPLYASENLDMGKFTGAIVCTYEREIQK